MESQTQALPFAFQWAEWGAAIVVGFLALAGSFWAFWRWSGRPRFIVGVPPFPTEKIPNGRIGYRTIRDQFRHKKDCFAVRLWEKQINVLWKKRRLTKLDERKIFNNHLRCRYLHLSPENCCVIPVIAENCGRRAARDYNLEIVFHDQRVHVIDVVIESLDMYIFCCNRIDLLENPDKLMMHVGSKAIMDTYDSYMGKYGDLIFFKGTLESGTYEMVLLKVMLEPEVKRFAIGYSLDCADSWVSRETFYQGFKIDGK